MVARLVPDPIRRHVTETPPLSFGRILAHVARLAVIAVWLLSATHAYGRQVSFPTSASAPAQAEFLRGVTALHNFEYEEAHQAFVRARTLEPRFVMAFWGEAMTYHQTLWRNEDVAGGRRALSGLGATPRARAAKAATASERAWLGAVEHLFGDGAPEIRRQAYAEAMAQLHHQQPQDAEAASFYALALMGTMSRSLIGFVDSHEGHSMGLAGSAIQTQVAAILEAVLRANPRHPGALHYLLHNYDDPAHAHLALAAAQTYAQVAPASSHALHMPAHIFLQLGRWDDAERSDRAAFTASDAWVTRNGLPLALRSYHALAWRQYELLQLGRFDEAWRTLDELAPVVKATGDVRLLSDLSSMRARFVIETRRWALMANERNFGNAMELCAIGMAAARSGNPSLAELARQALAARASAPEEGDLRPAIALMERQVAALIALAAGQGASAVETLTAAAAAELTLPPPLGLPAPIKPTPELLGEVLVEIGRPAEAIAPFQQALSRNANRTLSRLGLARAFAARGDHAAARDQYQKVLDNYSTADTGLAELTEARAALEPPPALLGRRPSLVAGAAAVGIAGSIGALALFAWRRRTRRSGTPRARSSMSRAERRRRDRARR